MDGSDELGWEGESADGDGDVVRAYDENGRMLNDSIPKKRALFTGTVLAYVVLAAGCEEHESKKPAAASKTVAESDAPKKPELAPARTKAEVGEKTVAGS